MRKGRKGLIMKTLERCRSIGGGGGGGTNPSPKGFLAVHVGAGRERFVVRTECLNHPLFRGLLEEAETEYGYAVEGPLELPCDVEAFHAVLSEIEQDAGGGGRGPSSPLCGLARSQSKYRLLSPAQLALVGKSY
ncbi:auxin-responsive protein SAUR50-like [Ananas comosus]|uniref:Auxin-responsive protein SAUR40 n=2 Tax=Ananas comosus TaxID=4615 RepID=A0A199VYG8_ANACO|nr:auxin-responsive protein SAUR50-like [Ananas comosus]OAY82277.1 Auxin-responsive protein SAUR40 [Ananas comosus]